MIKPDLFLTLEIGSDTKKVTDIISLLPQTDQVKYYNIGDLRERDKSLYKESFYRYRYYDYEAFDANLFVENFFKEIDSGLLIKIIALGFDVILIFHIIMPRNINTVDSILLPDAGLSAVIMKLLSEIGIDYHVNFSI